jgi:chromosome partitioning protein
MIQERNSGPISAQENYMQQLRRRGDQNVFSNYVKRNDTLFADAPESGVPVVLRPFSAGTYRSVVKGLEDVTDEFIELVGL